MNAKETSELKARLEEERARLAHEVSDLERDSATNLADTSGENNYRDHMADQGTATFGHFGQWRDPKVYRWEATPRIAQLRAALGVAARPGGQVPSLEPPLLTN